MANALHTSLRSPLVVSFVVVFALTAALFGATFQTQIAVAQSNTIDGAVTELTVGDDEESLLVTIRAENPTSKAMTLTTAQFVARTDGEELTNYGTQSLSDAVLAPGEATTFTISLELLDGEADAARAAIEDNEISVGGELVGYIENVRISFGVNNDG
ncbi:hypothetical protein AUR64_09935 [Haloprofundus marisrubri]|uniref:Uncharacterized protein n=1 Tax=Haloprofundus marisrubri TaxID=1514971 RepID=A0A0W1R942_9EURY|nr:hypothetical protein [Haloprofundus marisrubri]KTG09933.1 hypothetical protein AUR64_09935 [Haloprofundus marisrubri]